MITRSEWLTMNRTVDGFQIKTMPEDIPDLYFVTVNGETVLECMSPEYFDGLTAEMVIGYYEQQKADWERYLKTGKEIK